MEAPQINRIITLSAVLLTGLLTTGCNDTNGGSKSGIYGIYEGTSADYSHGGAATQVIDNGFSVDGMGVTIPKGGSKPTQVTKDALAGSSKDTLAGKNTDTLSGSDASPLQSNSDPLGSGGDQLDPDSQAKSLTTDGQNFYSYWIRGHAVNATVVVKINEDDVPIYGPIDEEVSDLVHPGMNRVDVKYTPIDSTSSALISVRKGAPDIPDSVHFDSNAYALSDPSTSSSSSTSDTPKVITKTYYFIAD